MANVTKYGVPFSRFVATGGGGPLTRTIDGTKPADGTTGSAANQWDDYHGGGAETDTWIGLIFIGEVSFTSIMFQEGGAYSDGGFFTAEPTIEVRVGGTWTAVSSQSCSPSYNANNALSFEQYTFSFTAIAGDGIRVRGDPGGSSSFISCGEIEVNGSLVVTDHTAAGTAIEAFTPTGGGGPITVIKDGVKPEPGSGVFATSYDSYHGGGVETSDYVGLTFPSDRALTCAIFLSGIDYGTGGFFASTPTIQVRVSGVWTSVSSQTLETYALQGGGPTTTYRSGDGNSEYFRRYLFKFASITGDGIRIQGTPGGSQYFISCGEFEAFGVTSSGDAAPLERAGTTTELTSADYPLRRLVNVAALVLAAGAVDQPPRERPLTIAEWQSPEAQPRRRVNVPALAVSIPVNAPPLARRRIVSEAVTIEPPVRRRLRAPESVDEPTFLLWSGFEDDYARAQERVQSARRFAFGGSQAGAAAPPLARWRAAQEPPTEEGRPRRLRRLPESVDRPLLTRARTAAEPVLEPLPARALRRSPESVDAPPLRRARQAVDAPAEGVTIRLLRRAPESVDQPVLGTRTLVDDTPFEELRIRRLPKLPDAIASVVDAPPAPRWRTINDTPAVDVRSQRSRWVLPSGAAVIPDQPLSRWRTALEPAPEEARIRRLLRLPESVDEPAPFLWAVVDEAAPEERVIRRALKLPDAIVAPSDSPLARWRTATEPVAEETRVRVLRRLPESVDAPPLARARATPAAPQEERSVRLEPWSFIASTDHPLLFLRRTIADTAPADLPLRQLRGAPESVDAPPFTRWRTAFDTPPEEPRPRQLVRWSESYVPPPVDEPPLRLWRTAFDEPLAEDLPIRQLLVPTGPVATLPYSFVVTVSFVIGATPVTVAFIPGTTPTSRFS